MRLFSILLIASAALISGCAATISRDSQQSAAVAVNKAASKNLYLEVSAPTGTYSLDDWNALLEEWSTSMGAMTTEKGINFKMVKTADLDSSTNGVLIKMKVNDFRYVSQVKRYAVGIFSGNAYLDLDVEFIELPTMKRIASRKYQTSSSAWQGVFSPMTPKQVQAVSKEIVSEVAGS